MPPLTMASSCFGARADEDVMHRVRRQHADEMAEKQEQHADVEQVAAPAQLPSAQHLRGIALPGVLIAVKRIRLPTKNTVRQM